MKLRLLVKILLGILLYFIFIHEEVKEAGKALTRRNWVLVEGKILEVFLEEKPHSVSKRYVSTCLRYSYAVEGKDYIASEVLVADQLYPQSTALEVLLTDTKRKYPSGKSIDVKMNPENNTESATGLTSDTFLYSITGGLALELLLIFSIVRDFRKGKKKEVK